MGERDSKSHFRVTFESFLSHFGADPRSHSLLIAFYNAPSLHTVKMRFHGQDTQSFRFLSQAFFHTAFALDAGEINTGAEVSESGVIGARS